MRSSNKRSPGRGRTALNGILEISKPPPNPSENVAALQQQLKAARTCVHNLTVEKNAAWWARDEARLLARRMTCAQASSSAPASFNMRIAVRVITRTVHRRTATRTAMAAFAKSWRRD
jgi:hypothetical protein